jgi:hypothetical protein
MGHGPCRCLGPRSMHAASQRLAWLCAAQGPLRLLTLWLGERESVM